jgi:hypothetical protein
MAFLLGSFTNGLFGGVQDAFNIANDWQKVKSNRMELQRQQDLMTAGKDTAQALDTDATTSKGPTGVSTVTPIQKMPEDTGYKPSDITSMPLPTFMQKQHQPAVHTASNQSFSGGSQGQAQGQAVPTQAPVAANPTTTSALPAPRTAPPQYLPSNVQVAPNSPLVNQPRSAIGSYAGPVMGTPMSSPGSVLPQQGVSPAMPSMANSMPGLGAQILQSLNPVNGPVQ